jgi:hypothetical protein
VLTILKQAHWRRGVESVYVFRSPQFLGFQNLEQSMERNVRILFLRALNAVTWCRFAARALDLTPNSTRHALRRFAEMARATATAIFGAMLFPAFTLASEPYVGAAAGHSFAHFHTTDVVDMGYILPWTIRLVASRIDCLLGIHFARTLRWRADG